MEVEFIPLSFESANTRRYFPKHKIPKNIDHQSIDLNHDLTYREEPIKILDEDVRLTRRRKIKFYKVQWSNHSKEEATWEREDYLRSEFPNLFSS